MIFCFSCTIYVSYKDNDYFHHKLTANILIYHKTHIPAFAPRHNRGM